MRTFFSLVCLFVSLSVVIATACDAAFVVIFIMFTSIVKMCSVLIHSDSGVSDTCNAFLVRQLFVFCVYSRSPPLYSHRAAVVDSMREYHTQHQLCSKIAKSDRNYSRCVCTVLRQFVVSVVMWCHVVSYLLAHCTPFNRPFSETHHVSLMLFQTTFNFSICNSIVCFCCRTFNLRID